MKTFSDIAPLRAALDDWHRDRETVAFVPTMGNLHKGHMSLVRLAHEYAEHVVVSIFVNPTQFGPSEDYDAYPRTLANDKRRLTRAGVDALFTPTVETMYPHGEKTATQVVVPGVSDLLCGADRPGHFAGVTSVVSRLFNVVQPGVAVFGQKDYQQLVIIRRMVADLSMPIDIIAGPTVREPDGLAMSSRNQYLTAEQREIAPGLRRTLEQCRESLYDGNEDYDAIERQAIESLAGIGFEPDYMAIRAAADLSPPSHAGQNLVVLGAARLGRARLIDNLLVTPDSR